MTVDLRLLTGVGRPIPRLFAAPRLTRPRALLTGSSWSQSLSPPAAGFGWGGSQPGGWLHQGAGVELGGAPPAPAPGVPSAQQLSEWWQKLNAQLYYVVTNPGLAIKRLVGLDLPREAVDPVMAREYLADLLETMGTLHNWPSVEVAKHVTAIRVLAPAGTVVATIDRILASAAPPKDWPGVDGWYQIAAQVRSSAYYSNIGERLSLWQSAGLSALQAAQRLRAELVEQGQKIVTSPGFWKWVEEARVEAQRMLTTMHKAAIAVPAGLAVGVGAIAAGAALIFFAPELMAAGGAAKTAAQPAVQRARQYAATSRSKAKR